MPNFYEFFAGGGMARAGLGPEWTCAFANDFSASKAKSYEANWGTGDLHVGDVNKVTTGNLPGHADLAWASFPCQDLSLAGNGAGLKGARSGTFWGFWKLIKGLSEEDRKPRMVVLENVYGTLTSHGGKDFEAIAKAVSSEGYKFGVVVMDAVQFVPQSRPRVFFICVDDRLAIPDKLCSERATPAWHPEKVISAYNGLPKAVKNHWIWWNMPNPVESLVTLENVIEEAPTGVAWHSRKETSQILSLMAPLNIQKVKNAQASGRIQVGAIYKRTREGIQRAEVRFDGIAGCLRTPGGGSSRQTIMIVDGNSIKTRLISPREAARLMGLPDSYKLPSKYNDSYHLLGDGVVAPVVSHIGQHILLPVVEVNKRIKVRKSAA